MLMGSNWIDDGIITAYLEFLKQIVKNKNDVLYFALSAYAIRNGTFWHGINVATFQRLVMKNPNAKWVFIPLNVIVFYDYKSDQC
jgi:hypothetical protein